MYLYKQLCQHIHLTFSVLLRSWIVILRRMRQGLIRLPCRATHACPYRPLFSSSFPRITIIGVLENGMEVLHIMFPPI